MPFLPPNQQRQSTEGITVYNAVVQKMPKVCNQVIVLGAARRYAPHRWQFNSWQIYVRLWTGPQSAYIWWLAAAKLQAGSVPTA